MEKGKPHTHVWRVVGLDCPTCGKEIESEIRAVEGVASADLDFMAGVVRVLCNIESGCEESLEGISREHGVTFRDASPKKEIQVAKKIPAETRIMIFSAAFIIASYLIGAPLLLLAALCISGYPVAGRALSELRRRQIGMNLLMMIAALGAVVIGEWSEGAMVLFLFSIARWLERLSSEKARSSIEALKLQLPSIAHVISEKAGEIDFPASAVTVGDRIKIKPGEKIPLDGKVLDGRSGVDESVLTGESEPVAKSQGDDVYAGTINQTGVLTVEVTKMAAESHFSRIMLSVQQAQSRKTKIQTSIEKFAEIYTPVVVVSAVIVALLPPLIFNYSFVVFFHTALVLLVIACPCALVLATPVTHVASMVSAAQSGILLRGGDVLEALSKIKVAAFDKTGTITIGEPRILELIPIDQHEGKKLLRVSAALEACSEHPLAGAFRKKVVEENISLPEVASFQAVKGHGIMGIVDNVAYRLGHENWALEACSQWKGRLPEVSATCVTVSLLCDESGPLGIITLGDAIRPEAKETISAIKKCGIQETLLLSGDRHEVADEYGKSIGIDRSFGRLTPADKSERLTAAAKQTGPTLMIGDGINDTVALASADVGIAMGKRGADAALETAGAVLLHDDLSGLSRLLEIAARSRRIIRQNIALAVGLKLTVFALSCAGIATLWMAVMADTGASLLVVINGLRALRAY